ncbi:MAG TPA: sulfatase-like hydrolase/transferase [Planctomycetota bacterium]|nr:sulfatase-like hydrolase/transferase [Planctomycetota bacterium]
MRAALLVLALGALVGGALLGGGLGLAGCGPPGGEVLDVILVSLDTTRPDHLSGLGASRNTTPTLARLASEGAVFDSMRSAAPWTLPSHVSLFTGLPPAVHDVVIDFQSLDRSRRTLGEIFGDAGFRTMGVFSAPYVHGHYGFARGMDFYERATLDPMIFDLPRSQMKAQIGQTERRSHTEVTSRLVVDRALNLRDHVARERNLMFLHFFDPHYDYKAPPAYLRRFADPAYAGPVTGDNVSDPAIVHAGMPAADLAQLQALYDAELAWVDDNLKRLVEAIEASGRARQTVLVITSDHGEEFLEHGHYGHRSTLHDEELRVPCIVWAPGRVKPGTVVKDEVANYDVLPTLMDYAGIAPEPSVYGRSLRPLIEGGSLPPRPSMAALSFFSHEPAGYYVQHDSMVFQGLKLIRRIHVAWSPKDERNLSGRPDPASEQIEVYDLAADPRELHDLAAENDPRVPGLRRAFDEECRRQAGALAAYQRRGSDSSGDTGLTLQESMQAVGYLAAGRARDAKEKPAATGETPAPAEPVPDPGPTGPR